MWIFKIILFIIALLMLCPGMYVLWAWYRNNFSMKYLMQNLNYATDLDGFGGLPPVPNFDVDNTVTYARCDLGYFIGLDDLGHVDGTETCREVCDSGDYDYKYIDKNGIFINNKEIRGAWCLPKPVSRCNLNTSNAYIGINRYECITKFPELLGGPYGNEIIGCGPNNTFLDMLEQQTYSKFIPTNLILNDLDERLPSGDYRYKCKFDPNQYFSLEHTNIGGRFDIETNSCSLFNSPGTLDLKTLTCKCENKINVNDDINLPCTNCTSGYGIVDEDRKQLGSRYGYSIGKDCVHPDRVTHHESLLSHIPCGVSKLIGMKETQKASCQRTLIIATNTFTPEMMETIIG